MSMGRSPPGRSASGWRKALNGQSKIQVDGTGVWKQLRDMPEFATLLPPPPPPVPPSRRRASSAFPRRRSANNPVAAWAWGPESPHWPAVFCQSYRPSASCLGVAHSQLNQNPIKADGIGHRRDRPGLHFHGHGSHFLGDLSAAPHAQFPNSFPLR